MAVNVPLPEPPDRYDRENEAQTRAAIELAFSTLPDTGATGATGAPGGSDRLTQPDTTQLLMTNIADGDLLTRVGTNIEGTDPDDFADAVHVHAAADITSGTVATARLGSGTADSTTFLRGDQTYAVPTGGGVTGMVDPTDYGYVTVDTDESPTVSAWAALSAAAFACYNAEIDGVATGGSTTTLVDATEDFSGTFTPSLYNLDDRIDAGAGNDFTFEVCFLSGDNKGRYSNIDVVDSATQLTLDPALPFAVAAGDEYRIMKSSKTQTRSAKKALWIPPGRALIDDEITAIRGTSSFHVVGGGMGVSMLEFATEKWLAATTFDSSTSTTLTKTGANWPVDFFVGSFIWCWDNGSSRDILSAGKIVSNTIDTITVDHWAGATPVAASQTFAIGLRSALFLNGVGNTSYSEFQVYTGISREIMLGIAVQWMRPGWTPPAPDDLCAFSSSQNLFTHVEVFGRCAYANMMYGNFMWAKNNQVDNGDFIGCKFWGTWDITVSSDQRYDKNAVQIGDGLAGNSLITAFFGGACFRCQTGVTVAWQDIIMVGTTLQSNGHTTLTNSSGAGLSDIHIVGISAYCGFYGCRSEGSSRLLSTHTGNSIFQHLELVQCTFHIGGNLVFAADGYVIHCQLHGPLRLAGIWISGDDPVAYAISRFAKCYHLLGLVNCEAVSCVGSNIHEFFPAGLSAPVRWSYYAELDNGNGIVKEWVGGGFLASTNIAAVAGDHWHWEGEGGVAPDVSHGRSAAGHYEFNETLQVNGFKVATASKTGAYTLSVTDHSVYCDATGGAFTVTLPTVASAGAGRRYEVTKTDASGNAVTVDGNGAETISGVANVLLPTQYDSVTVECTGTAWLVK